MASQIMQRSFTLKPRSAKKLDNLLDSLGYVWERTPGRTRYAISDFMLSLVEGEVVVDRKNGKATLTFDLPEFMYK